MKLVRAEKGYRKVGDKWLLAKKCSECGRWLVASKVNFNKQAKGKYGLNNQCKGCVSKYNKQYRQANKDKIAEYKKQYRQANKEKVAECEKQYRQANKEKVAEYQKQYYKDNKDKIDEQHKQYYETNKDKILEQYKQYRQANKEKIAEYHKQWSRTPQGQVIRFNSSNRRRIKKEQQGTGATSEQWLEMMSFFDWRCAYTGKRLTNKTRSLDHIVPLDAGGDHMIWNMVPMLRNLNSSKKTKEMLEWYRGQDFFSEARLAKIYKWQEYAYNKWGKDTEYFNTNDIQISLI